MLKFLAGASALALAVSPAAAQTATPASGTDPQRPAISPDGATPASGADVIVTANPFGTETPTIVAKVNRDAILKTGGDSISDALAGVPGISDTSFAPGANRPIIRGQDAARVRVLENGASSSDVSDVGPDHGIPVDPLSAQSIEVVRGAATLRYGSQAIGGVVNIINNRVPSVLPTRPFNAEASGSFGTVNNAGEGTLLADGRAGNIALHADGFYRYTDDYDTPLGTQQNSFFRGHGETGGATVFFGPDNKSRVGAAIEQYNSRYGIPSDDTYLKLRQTKYVERSSFDLGEGLLRSLNVDASYANYRHTENEPDGTVDTTFRNKEFDGRGELLFGPLGAIQNSAVGVEIQHRNFSAVGEDASYLFPTKTDTQAGYLFTDTPVGDAFHLQVAGRVEHIRVTGTPASDVPTRRNYTPLSGSIGALYDFSGAVKLGATFSSTGRAPLITELFARGGHDGPNTFETGDPTLKIERSNSLEGTLRVTRDRLRFEGSLYSSWFSNYIYGDLTGRTCDDDGNCVVGDANELRELNYRQQGAWFRGVEADAHYAVFKRDETRVELHGLADYTRATFDHDRGNVPRIPPYRVGGGLDLVSRRLDAGAMFTHAGRQNEYGAFDTRTPGYNQLTAQATLRPFASHPGIELAVVGQNLTDDVQRNAAALNKDSVVLPGRNVRFVLRVATF
ncbi:TonB-dependent receptor [Sphingomonas bacterium]|uniref:TonB-dependent receptor n=1 Tax=Sphingomonas bacterium TaxID=1895847 RepID=UPI001575C4C0|nr:TonB-dependent receptor [Sphingomonas bacterium]